MRQDAIWFDGANKIVDDLHISVLAKCVHWIAALMRSAPPAYCTQSSSPATSIAYSRDGNLFAAGYQNGILQLWKGMEINF